MKKILVVDDEVFSRVAIEESIKDSDQSIQVFSAANGEEALKIIEKEDLSVIMTDIKMPVMSGMELLTKIRKMDLDIQVIILSSYNEFDLVRKAIQLGAFDYLFKPAMLPEDILEVVNKAFNRQSEKLARLKSEELKTSYNQLKEKEMFFSELLKGDNSDGTRYKEFAKIYGISEDINKIIVTIFQLDLYQDSLIKIFQNDINLLKVSVYNVFNEILRESPNHQFICNNFHEYIMISWEHNLVNENEFAKKNVLDIQQIISFLKDKYNILLSAGTSNIGKSFEDISDLYVEATFDTIKSHSESQNTNQPNEGKRDICLEPEMTKAIEYIKNRLSDKNLSLQMIANHIGFSKNYFSKVFKETMGMNFIDYVTRLRVEKAKELYINTNMRIYEIAELVGYSDWHYLYNVYKKFSGHSLSHEISKK